MTKRQKWNFFLLGFLVLAAVSYLQQINKQAEFSFQAQILEKQKQGKINEIKKINWDLAEQRALGKIQERALSLNLVKAASTSFLNAQADSVARGN